MFAVAMCGVDISCLVAYFYSELFASTVTVVACSLLALPLLFSPRKFVRFRPVREHKLELPVGAGYCGRTTWTSR